MPVVINGTTGIETPGVDADPGTVLAQTLTVNSNNISAVNSLGFRNRLINPGMVIDQRNAGASVTPTTSNNVYPVDRWLTYASQATKYTAQQNAGSVTPPTGFSNYLGFTSSSAYSVTSSDFFLFGQKIEGFNFADMGWGAAGAQTITLSFWVRSSLTGTFGGALRNSANNRFYVFSYSISAANTWEQKTITIAGDTSGTWVGATNGVGVEILWSLGTGSSVSGSAGSWGTTAYYGVTGGTSVVGTNGATFYITGVQLEAGSVATPFERVEYGAMLRACQRYYEKSYEQATAPGSASTSGYSSMNNPDQGSAVYVFNTDRFAVPKRTAATMRFWDLAGNLSRITDYTLGGLARTDGRNSVYTYTGYQSSAVMINVQSASTAGTYQWDASAEL